MTVINFHHQDFVKQNTDPTLLMFSQLLYSLLFTTASIYYTGDMNMTDNMSWKEIIDDVTVGF